MWLCIAAFWQLIRFQYYILRGDFALLYQRVREYPLSASRPSRELVHRLCAAMDMACIWYPKQVLCLQRSAATACFLRQYGASALMVIGVQKLPFKAHAWVELEGRPVNDKSYTSEMYVALDRC